MRQGVLKVFPQAQTHALPLADGGEGTVEALLHGAGGTAQVATVTGPLGDEVEAVWGLLPGGRAVIEMAQASGLPLIPPDRRDALRASTYGTGQLMKAALDAGCRELLIGIGGSATTDGGTGALAALGAKFLDAQGQELSPGGAALNDLHRIDLSWLDTRLSEVTCTVLCDVTNPLFGENGAAFIYGPQKGASPEHVKILDSGLQRLAQISVQALGEDKGHVPGAGAAGGLGFALAAYCNAQMKSGIEVVLETAGFAEKLQDATLVLTGEGALDAQTLSGKTIAGVCRVAGEKNVPVIAFGGKVALCGEQLDELGLLSAFPIADAPLTLEECLARAGELLSGAVERALRVYRVHDGG